MGKPACEGDAEGSGASFQKSADERRAAGHAGPSAHGALEHAVGPGRRSIAGADFFRVAAVAIREVIERREWLTKIVFGAALGAALISSPVVYAKSDPVFSGTAADMTSNEFAAAAERGAVVLWALGAIEQHGPHLPLATDVYIPQAQLAAAAARLRSKGVEVVVLPPYYWGVNQVTGSYPGSINIRPETMEAVMVDVFTSLKTTGFREVYCITGHWDAAHGRSIARAVAANDLPAFRVRFVVPKPLADRLELSGDTVLRVDLPSFSYNFPDVHAGDDETSVMLAVRPATVRKSIARRLPPANLSPDRFKAWRSGGGIARRIAPSGYVGNPASADADRGRRRAADNAKAISDVIIAARAAAAGGGLSGAGAKIETLPRAN